MCTKYMMNCTTAIWFILIVSSSILACYNDKFEFVPELTYLLITTYHIILLAYYSWADYLNPFHAYEEGNLSWLVQ
jgi:hypothetical protein